MEEKIIIEGTYDYISKLKKFVLILVIIDIILGIISYILDKQAWSYVDEQHAYPHWSKDYQYFHELHESYFGMSNLTFILFIAILVIAIIIIIFFIAIKNTQLVITNKRAYGRVLWGKRVDLPLDSISAIATSANIFKGICISTSSGKIVFYYISNRDDIHKEVSKLLIDRQNANKNINSISSQNSSNNMDDIFKLKEMFDVGIISQEEFDTKKRQLLGL